MRSPRSQPSSSTRIRRSKLSWLLIFSGLACAKDDPAELDETPSTATAATPNAAEMTAPNAEAGPESVPSAESEPQPEPEPIEPPLPAEPEPAAPEEAPTPRERARLEQAGDLGRAVTDALRAGDAKAVLDLTPYGNGEWKKRCPSGGDVSGQREVKARIQHCIDAIEWERVSDVRLEGGEPSGGQAEGCADGTEAFERIRMLVVVPGKDWIVSLNHVVGQDAVAKGFAGAIACERRD